MSSSSNPTDIIVIKDLRKQFGKLVALRNVNLTLKRGTVTVIIGPSGSGKSTLLRCMNHLETESGGEVYIDGELLTKNDKKTASAIGQYRHGVPALQPFPAPDRAG